MIPLTTFNALVMHDPAHSALSMKEVEYGVQRLGFLELALDRLSVCSCYLFNG